MSSSNIFEKQKNTNSETEEEKIIKSLVDDIYEYEEKILEINSTLEKSTTLSSYDESIINLKKKENELKDNINLIKIKENDEINKKQNKINEKQNMLNSIDNQLNEYINKLNTFNTLSFSSLLMTKYIISNNINEFLTKEQIDNIINSAMHGNQNSNINKNEKNMDNNLEKEIDDDINKLKDKINQLNENLYMMKEEKKIVNNELIELISCKETIDSLAKTSLNNLTEDNNNSNNKNNNEPNNKEDNIDEKEYITEEFIENNNIILPEIYSYELSLLDISKISKNICNELYDVFNIKNNELNKINNNNNTNNTKLINNIEYNNIKEYNKELSLNISDIKQKKEDKDNYTKNNLEILIKSELDTFILSEIKNKDIINNLLNNLCIIISTKLQLLDVEDIPIEKLKIFLIYYFKSIYYDNIIENIFKFINKDYKIIKKEIKKKLDNIKNEINILENKKEEIISNKKKNKKNKTYLANKDNYNNEGLINLTKSEQEYIQICSKGNNLLKQKEEIKNNINDLEENIVKIKNGNNEEINKITKELEEINQEIINMKNNEDKNKIKLNDDILNYRKIISDKFDLIKKQLKKYKNKYGSNLGIYNRLIDGINNTIRQTYNKYPSENINVNNHDYTMDNKNKKFIFNNGINNINEGKKDNFNNLINSIQTKEEEKNYQNINNYINTNISNNININNTLINKLLTLTKSTLCYIREITNITNKFNPLDNSISFESLIEAPYNFVKSIIVLNKTYDSISLISQKLNLNYGLKQIENTIMNSYLKIIIEIHRDYRKYKNANKNNNNWSLNDFIKKEKVKNYYYDNKFIEKCAMNKYFNFSLLINNGKRIEIVLCSYEDFKLWINGFAFILKNKKQIIKMTKSKK